MSPPTPEQPRSPTEGSTPQPAEVLGYEAARRKPVSLSGRFQAAPLPTGTGSTDLDAVVTAQRYAQAGGASGVAVKKTKAHSLEGLTLMFDPGGAPITATRVLGTTDGYNSRLEAVAAARMSHSDTAFVVQKGGRWFAVEADKSGLGDHTTSSDNGLGAVEPLLPYNEDGIASLRADLAKALADGDDARVKSLRLTLASALFGVPESEIAIISDSADRQAGKINILDLPKGTLGEHGPEKDHGEEFTPGKKTAIEIDRDLLMGPDYPKKGEGGDALGVLFHESSHQYDYQLAQKWVSVYEKETGKTFHPSRDGDPAFTVWLDKRVGDTKKKPALSTAEMMLVTDATRRGVNGNTEARAYLGSFIGALQAGSPEAARDQLLTWTKGQPGSIPVPSQQVENEMFRKMEAAYRAMPKDQRAAFDAALQEAQAVKNSPLKRFDHATALKLP